MDEKKISSKLKHGILLIICFSIFLLILTVLFLVSSRRSTQTMIRQEMAQEAVGYRDEILLHLEDTRPTLQTLAALMAAGGMTDLSSAAEGLSLAVNENNFVSIMFAVPDGAGVLATSGQGVKMYDDYHTLSQPVVDALDSSMDGEYAVSHLFYSDLAEQRVFVCSVPVYQGENLIGVLAASSHVDIFEQILEDQTVSGKTGSVYLIGSEGNFLVHFPDNITENDIISIFDVSSFDQSNKAQMKTTLANGESAFSSFRYQGRSRYYYMTPIGVNGWYLFYTNAPSDLMIQQNVNMLTFAFTGIILLVMIFLIYSFRLIQKSNRNLVYSTNHDSLTGAMNITFFERRLSEILPEEKDCCVAAINIHQFKFINEIFGQQYGNDLLQAIKSILDDSLEDGEFFCRYNADSFYLYLNSSSRPEVTGRIQHIFEQISHWSWQNQKTYQILMYAGVVKIDRLSEYHAQKTQAILIHLLFALDKARELPAGAVWFYDTELHEVEKLENYIRSHMNQALEQEEFQLYLQPKICLSNHKLGGAEALVRWFTKDGRTIYPNHFIPMFEQNGFCIQLDMYMLEQVCRKIRDWIDRGITPIPISVNQSKLLFYEADYTRRLSDLKEKYRIPDGMITLEILEGLAMKNTDIINRKIRYLQGLGFQVSMDDFGSGYSSFHTLGSLQIDELKIDRSFLLELTDENVSTDRIYVILQHIITLARDLHIRTVAEGVETEEDEILIRSLGCDYGQGYYYSKPMPVAEFEEKYFENNQESSSSKP